MEDCHFQDTFKSPGARLGLEAALPPTAMKAVSGRNMSIIDAALPPSNVTGEIRRDASSGASCSKAARSDRLIRGKISSAKRR